jgi:hypothetical protein
VANNPLNPDPQLDQIREFPPKNNPSGDQNIQGVEPAFLNHFSNEVDPKTKSEEGVQPRIAVIILHATGDKTRDVRRLRRIHGALVSNPGQDHFSFQVFENNRSFVLDFPNESTGLTPQLITYLVEQAGEGNLRIQ